MGHLDERLMHEVDDAISVSFGLAAATNAGGVADNGAIG